MVPSAKHPRQSTWGSVVCLCQACHTWSSLAHPLEACVCCSIPSIRCCAAYFDVSLLVVERRCKARPHLGCRAHYQRHQTPRRCCPGYHKWCLSRQRQRGGGRIRRHSASYTASGIGKWSLPLLPASAPARAMRCKPTKAKPLDRFDAPAHILKRFPTPKSPPISGAG